MHCICPSLLKGMHSSCTVTLALDFRSLLLTICLHTADSFPLPPYMFHSLLPFVLTARRRPRDHQTRLILEHALIRAQMRAFGVRLRGYFGSRACVVGRRAEFIYASAAGTLTSTRPASSGEGGWRARYRRSPTLTHSHARRKRDVW